MYCVQHVCLSAHISEKPHVHISPTFCTCCLWPWLIPLLMAVQYVTYFQFYGLCHLIYKKPNVSLYVFLCFLCTATGLSGSAQNLACVILYPPDGHGGVLGGVSECCLSPRAGALCTVHTLLQISGELRWEIRN